MRSRLLAGISALALTTALAPLARAEPEIILNGRLATTLQGTGFDFENLVGSGPSSMTAAVGKALAGEGVGTRIRVDGAGSTELLLNAADKIRAAALARKQAAERVNTVLKDSWQGHPMATRPDKVLQDNNRVGMTADLMRGVHSVSSQLGSFGASGGALDTSLSIAVK
jgi:hypothetical protein